MLRPSLNAMIKNFGKDSGQAAVVQNLIDDAKSKQNDLIKERKELKENMPLWKKLIPYAEKNTKMYYLEAKKKCKIPSYITKFLVEYLFWKSL